MEWDTKPDSMESQERTEGRPRQCDSHPGDGRPCCCWWFLPLQGVTSIAASSETPSGAKETHPAPPSLASPDKCALNMQDSIGKDKIWNKPQPCRLQLPAQAAALLMSTTSSLYPPWSVASASSTCHSHTLPRSFP